MGVRVRLAIGFVGLAALWVGLTMWNFESTYGSEGHNYSVECFGTDACRVTDVDEQDPAASAVVFTGTEAEVTAWIDDHMGRDYTLEIVVIVAALVCLAVAILPIARPSGHARAKDG